MVDSSYSERIKESYGGAYDVLSDRYSKETFTSYVQKHPVRAVLLGTVSGIAIGASAVALGPVVTFAQMVGFAGFFLARESATFQNHRHILATASASCAFSVAQQGLTAAAQQDPGAYVPGMIMLAHAAATTAAFAIIPEDKKGLRRFVTWGGGLLGAYAAATTAQQFGNESGLIPAATTLGNSVLFSMSDTNTPRARVGYMAMNLGHIFYWATQPVSSLGLLLTEAMYLGTHATTAAEHDMPVADRASGEKLKPLQSLGAYFTRVLGKGEKVQDIGVTRHEKGWERPDNKLYEKITGFIFGR